MVTYFLVNEWQDVPKINCPSSSTNKKEKEKKKKDKQLQSFFRYTEMQQKKKRTGIPFR